MIKEFSKEVIEQIGFYVYRLIDPRNGQTFYVGKGKGNRVFDHMKCAINYYGENKEIADDDSNKYKTIKQIQDEGLHVVHLIQRWNLTEKEAFEVESALIDVFQGLTNLQSGHHSEYGVTNAEALQRNLSYDEYLEPKDFKYILIKVKNESVTNNNSRYDATRGWWKINPKSIHEYPYVFSVTNGVVREVYKIKSWIKNNDRCRFDGEIAESYIREQYINKKIPKCYKQKGMASPILLSKN